MRPRKHQLLSTVAGTRPRASSAASVGSTPGAHAPNSPPDPLDLIGKRELASLLAVKIWVSGTTPRWRRSDIEAWLAARPVGGLAPDYGRAREPYEERPRASRRVAPR
jgi:hypothetical protein